MQPKLADVSIKLLPLLWIIFTACSCIIIYKTVIKAHALVVMKEINQPVAFPTPPRFKEDLLCDLSCISYANLLFFMCSYIEWSEQEKSAYFSSFNQDRCEYVMNRSLKKIYPRDWREENERICALQQINNIQNCLMVCIFTGSKVWRKKKGYNQRQELTSNWKKRSYWFDYFVIVQNHFRHHIQKSTIERNWFIKLLIWSMFAKSSIIMMGVNEGKKDRAKGAKPANRDDTNHCTDLI